MMEATREVEIVNDLGIHLRAAGALVQVAGQFNSDIWVSKDSMKANAKSIMSVLSLAASKGTTVTVSAAGSDATKAVDAVVGLIERGFEGK